MGSAGNRKLLSVVMADVFDRCLLEVNPSANEVG